MSSLRTPIIRLALRSLATTVMLNSTGRSLMELMGELYELGCLFARLTTLSRYEIYLARRGTRT